MQFKLLFLTMLILLSISFSSFAQDPTILNAMSPVHSVAFSPVDASLVASAGEDGTIKLWNVQNGTETTLRGHTAGVNSVAFSPNGMLLASGGDDYISKLWDVQNQQAIATLQHITGWNRSQIKAVVFSPDGELLVTAGWDVKLWTVNNQTELATLQHDQWVWALAFSPDGQHLATGDAKGAVKIWDVQNRRVIIQLEADTTDVYAVAFSPDGRTLASAGYDGQIKLWAVENWAPVGTLHNPGTVNTVNFLRDRNILASTGHEAVTLWSTENGEKIASLTGHIGWVNGVAFAPEGPTIASGGNDGTVRIQNIESLLQPQQEATVRVIYFLPNDRLPQPDIEPKLDRLIKATQQFFAEHTQANGFGKKTFTFETDADSALRVYRVNGKFDDRYYHTSTSDKVMAEIRERFDTSQHVYLIVADISSERIGESCGVGGGNWIGEGALGRVTSGGAALMPASGNCFDGQFGVDVAAHELGHAFGLAHDFRNDAYLMSYGADRTLLSPCAAEWLAVSYAFNADQTAFDEPATIHSLPPLIYPSNALSLRFQVTDTDGLHQAQLLTPATSEDPAPGSPKLLACKRLNGENQTFEFITPLTIGFSNQVTLQVIDLYGNITFREFTFREADILPAPNSGVPTALTKRSGDNQQGEPGAILPNPFVIRVTADDGSALEGINVTFAVIEGGGTLSQTTVTTDATGQAESTLTLGNSEGTNTVAVSTYGLQVFFNAEGVRIPTTLVKLSGDNQQGYPGVALENSLIVEVHDDNSLALEGVLVTFTVIAGGGTLSQTTVTTNAIGRAESTLTLGSSAGTNTVEVSAVGIQQTVVFNAAGTRKTLVADVNQDGVVNILDLVLVAGRFGQTGEDSADVNGDDIVNILDLVLVAGAFGNTTAAPAMHPQALELLTATEVKQWLHQAHGLALTDATSQRGVIFLKRLLVALTPKKTALLPNYPNPFNPETWIPYRLATDADVQLTIYDIKGAVVRRFPLGHQSAGFYTARSKAVHWNGRNESGESVASGVYFYQLRAANYFAVRRMVIVK